MRWFVLALFACGSTPSPFCDDKAQCRTDAQDVELACDPLTQTRCEVGQRCAWLVESTSPDFRGRVGCTAPGLQLASQPCQYDLRTGSDDCATGLVCSGLGGYPGVCRRICGFSFTAPCPDNLRCEETYAFFVGGRSVAGWCALP